MGGMSIDPRHAYNSTNLSDYSVATAYGERAPSPPCIRYSGLSQYLLSCSFDHDVSVILACLTSIDRSLLLSASFFGQLSCSMTLPFTIHEKTQKLIP